MQYTPVLIESRVDWLTVTAHTEGNRERLYGLGESLNYQLCSGVLGGREWAWRGYVGKHVTTLTYGRRDDSDILQLSQLLADDMFNTAWAYADNCTRVDLAVTLKFEEEVDPLVRQHYAEANRFRRESRPELGIKLIEGNEKAQTLYVGSRASDLFCRVYDKGAEAGNDSYQHCLRYELEVKGDPARRCAAYLAAAADRSAACASAVYQHVTRRGIQPHFSAAHSDMRINYIRPSTDDASRMAWLTNSVRPVIARLLLTRSPMEVLEALGIPRTASEKVRLGLAMEFGNHRDWLQEWRERDK